jgi:hypothetical protein
LIGPHDESNREQRIRELELRCIVARSIKRDQSIVIGIATNVYKKGTGHSYDLFFLKVADWTAEKEATATKIREELGYFKTMSTKTAGYDEYPPEKST